MEDQQEFTFEDITKWMGMAKQGIMQIAQANNNPSTMTMARQRLDGLDAAYLFANAMVADIAHREQQVEQAVASGNLVPFPGAANVPEA